MPVYILQNSYDTLLRRKLFTVLPAILAVYFCRIFYISNQGKEYHNNNRYIKLTFDCFNADYNTIGSANYNCKFDNKPCFVDSLIQYHKNAFTQLPAIFYLNNNYTYIKIFNLHRHTGNHRFQL